MDSFNTNNLAKGASVVTGTYLLIVAGHRVYKTITMSEANKNERKSRHLTRLGEILDIALNESATLSLGGWGAALLFMAFDLHRNH